MNSGLRLESRSTGKDALGPVPTPEHTSSAQLEGFRQAHSTSGCPGRAVLCEPNAVRTAHPAWSTHTAGWSAVFSPRHQESSWTQKGSLKGRLCLLRHGPVSHPPCAEMVVMAYRNSLGQPWRETRMHGFPKEGELVSRQFCLCALTFLFCKLMEDSLSAFDS
ncbi:unnamed protein product [Parnassius mnemosyne]|uniref:Uncharacterized protein n=1 Tax=Parnassius mnemosyne TaxID=213953 RepID=A0AAV1L9P9_9NEOP